MSRFANFSLGTLLVAVTVLADNPESITDRMSDDELYAYRETRVGQLRQNLEQVKDREEADGKAFEQIFFCTLYYTPKESGFTAERGFDVTPVRAPGLRGHKYPRDFLRAVKKEGFGRLREPVDGCNYVRWISGGRYAFAQAPLGRHGTVLIPKRSCAISRHNPILRQDDKLTIKSKTVNEETGSEEWIVTDTGGGLSRLQIDLYWGEDEPHGPFGRQPARPAGTWMEYAFETRVTVDR